MWRYHSYDEGRTDSGKTSSGRNPAFNLYLYIFIHRCINFFAILVSQVRCFATCTFLASLLQCIGQNFCMNNIEIVVFLYIILRVIIFIVFFVSIIGCHVILCYINSFCTFKFSSMTLSLSLSTSCAMDIVL